jgi:hypothetical protein
VPPDGGEHVLRADEALAGHFFAFRQRSGDFGPENTGCPALLEDSPIGR